MGKYDYIGQPEALSIGEEWKRGITSSWGNGAKDSWKESLKLPKKDNSSYLDDLDAKTGLTALKFIGDMWSGYQQSKIQKEQNRLAREAFEFNKDLSTKNFNLAKEDHDRRVRKSEAVSRQFAHAGDAWKGIDKKTRETRAKNKSLSIAAENKKRNRYNNLEGA